MKSNYQSIGEVSHSWGKARAWWVGTEHTRPGMEKLAAHQHRVDDILADLCRQAQADPEAVFLSGPYLRGFTPLDPDNPVPWLRPMFTEAQGMYIPDRRHPEGVTFSQRMHQLLPGRAVPDPVDFIGGVEGVFREEVAPGIRGAREVLRRPVVVLGQGENVLPVLLADFDPDDERSSVTVDPRLWQRAPIEDLHELADRSQR